jgi:hypothetical protein
MALEITASEMGLIRASVRQYKTRKLKGPDAKVFRAMVDRLLEKLDAESSKFGTASDTVEMNLLPPEVEAFAQSLSDLQLPSY